MKALIIIIVALTIGFLTARAQAPASAYTVGVVADHTKCSLSATQPGYCFATDGIWRQVTGDTAPVRIDVPVALPTNIVTSVNGKAPTSGNVSLAYADLASKPTTLKCTASDQSNTGLTGSGCSQQ